MKISTLPPDSKWSYIFGAGILGGIGFTMSIFISLLAFSDAFIIDQAKIAVLIASLCAGVVGFLFLKLILRKPS
jgi:NhaA family Na+:H+ antiporter